MKKTIKVLMFLLLCSISLSAEQIKPTTIDLIVEYFEKLNEIHKDFLNIPDGKEYIIVDRDDIEKYPMIFLEGIFNNDYSIAKGNKFSLLASDIVMSVLISLIDFPIVPYSMDIYIDQMSALGKPLICFSYRPCPKEEFKTMIQFTGWNNNPFCRSYELGEPSYAFISFGAHMYSWRDKIGTTEPLIYEMLRGLYDMLSFRALNYTSNKSKEIQARVANRNWSSMEIFDSYDSLYFISVTDINDKKRQELLNKSNELDFEKKEKRSADHQLYLEGKIDKPKYGNQYRIRKYFQKLGSFEAYIYDPNSVYSEFIERHNLGNSVRPSEQEVQSNVKKYWDLYPDEKYINIERYKSMFIY